MNRAKQCTGASYPPPRVVAVDVDGTLLINGQKNPAVVLWCERLKAEGYVLHLWSSRGKKHAESVAELFGVTHLFDVILSKPGFILDDQGWGWIKYTKAIHPSQLASDNGLGSS